MALSGVKAAEEAIRVYDLRKAQNDETSNVVGYKPAEAVANGK